MCLYTVVAFQFLTTSQFIEVALSLQFKGSGAKVQNRHSVQIRTIAPGLGAIHRVLDWRGRVAIDSCEVRKHVRHDSIR